MYIIYMHVYIYIYYNRIYIYVITYKHVYIYIYICVDNHIYLYIYKHIDMNYMCIYTCIISSKLIYCGFNRVYLMFFCCHQQCGCTQDPAPL